MRNNLLVLSEIGNQENELSIYEVNGAYDIELDDTEVNACISLTRDQLIRLRDRLNTLL